MTGSPGLPETEEICAPGILPTRAWSIEAVGAGGNLSPVTDSTAIPSFFLLVATPVPVTTTSLRDLESASRAIFNTEVPPTFISFVSKPTPLMIRVVPSGAFNLKEPSKSALVPPLAPLILILAYFITALIKARKNPEQSDNVTYCYVRHSVFMRLRPT